MKYNAKDIYNGRIEEIDKQLNAYVRQKKWDKVKQLREERKSILVTIKGLEEQL